MSAINSETVSAALQAEFGDKILSVSEPYGMLTVEIPREDALNIVAWLKNHPDFKVNFMTDLCGVHFPDQAGRELGVVYHLHSWVNNFRLRLKCFFPVSDPHAPSMTGLFNTANWMERETFDFYGIIFDGHPDLRRILNMDEMDYHPLRKEYALEDETRDDKDDRYFGR